MAISTYPIKLWTGTPFADDSEYFEQYSLRGLLDIKDFPDLGGAPEMLESTTLSDKMQTYIMGIQSQDALEFTANYTKADYDKVKQIEGTVLRFAVTFGEEMIYDNGFGGEMVRGRHGGFTFDGQPSVYVAGAGVNEVVEMKVVIAPSSPIEPIAAAT